MSDEQRTHIAPGFRYVGQAEVVRDKRTNKYVPIYFIFEGPVVHERGLPPEDTFFAALEALYNHLRRNPFG